MAYDSKKGWSLCTLNLFQQLLRKVFGCYKNTYLHTIASAWSKYCLEKDVNHLHESHQLKAFDKKIRVFWSASHSKQPFPEYTLIAGNVPLEQAQVICLAESHGDRAMRRMIADVVERYYHAGDVVLVEGVKAGKAASKKLPQVQLIGKECDIQGWDTYDVGQPDAIQTKGPALIDKLEKWFLEMRQALPKERKLEAAELVQVKAKVDILLQMLPELFSYFRPKKMSLESSVKTINFAFNELEKGKIGNADFIYILAKILRPIEKRQETAIYDHFTKEEDEKIDAAIAERNESLCLQIRQQLASKDTPKKVFIIAGIHHILDEKTASNVRQTFEQYPFAIVASNEDLQKFRFTLPASWKTFSESDPHPKEER